LQKVQLRMQKLRWFCKNYAGFAKSTAKNAKCTPRKRFGTLTSQFYAQKYISTVYFNNLKCSSSINFPAFVFLPFITKIICESAYFQSQSFAFIGNQL
jgi:hypothetical protein